MSKPFFILFFVISLTSFSQNWITNFEEAKEISVKQNQNIILVFQGSDWCAPCIKLDKEVFSTPEFQNLAKDRFVMLQADFPRRKANKLSKELTEQNRELASKYNNQGYFPLVVILDKDGVVLGKIGYEKSTPERYFKKLTAFEI